MKAVVLPSVVVLIIVLGTAGCGDHPFVAEDLPGVWTRPVDDNHFRLTFKPTSGWSQPVNGGFTVVRLATPDSVLRMVASGTYTLDGDVAVFTDTTCKTDMDVLPGTYRLQFDGALLKIGATDDACMSRRAVLNGTWETEP